MPTIQWTSGKVNSTTTGLNMAYEAAGDSSHPTVLLIAGLGCQLSMWSDEFCQPLLQKGYRLIRFDNRDIGLTDAHPESRRFNIPATFLRAKLGLKTEANYTLETMAEDAIGLIEALGLPRTHVVGISMGGMIAQVLAAKRPDLVDRLVTIMSSTNSPKLPMADLKVMNTMFLKRPKSGEIDDIAEHVRRVFQAIGSPAYPANPDRLRERAKQAFKRAHRPAGVLRQTHGVVASGSIEHFTRKVKAPTCVIHGIDDPLLKKECGERIAKLIPNARLHLIQGLGHDLPEELSDTFADLIHRHLAVTA